MLNNVADRLPLQAQQQYPKDTRLADLLFSKERIGCLIRIIAQEYSSQQTLASIELAASLISKLCTEEVNKAALAESGVLDALAAKVASFVVAQGFVLPGAERRLQTSASLDTLPSPAPPNASLAPILRAVTVVVEHSKWRAEHFLSSPPILAVFPKQPTKFSPHDIKKGPWGSIYLSGSAVPQQKAASPVDYFLPSVPRAQSKGTTSNFPPLNYQEQHSRHANSFVSPHSLLDASSSEEDENAIIPWLLYLVRAEAGMVRLMAARIVTVLFRLGLAKKQRVAMFSVLLIPVLIRMLDKDYLPGEDNPEYASRLKEEAPAVLATLVIDDQELQKHAVDGGAIKRLSQLLKESYNPVNEHMQPMWDANEIDNEQGNLDERLPPECKLGLPGYSSLVCHIMRYRENILKALAAIVPFKDEYRKAVCDNGVVPYIIDSLKPRSDGRLVGGSAPNNTAADGNPTATLLAACGAARMLTRSVSVLRTNLIDAGVATPLFVLIKHPDIDVQIAATSVICNLALDFSPMKEVSVPAFYVGLYIYIYIYFFFFFSVHS